MGDRVQQQGGPGSPSMGSSEMDENAIGPQDTSGLPQDILDILVNRISSTTSPFKWNLIAKWTDDDPFVGYRCPSATGVNPYKYEDVKTMATKMYKQIEGGPKLPHTSKPIDNIVMTQQFNIRSEIQSWKSAAAYTKAGAQPQQPPTVLSVFEISQKLNGLLPQPQGGLEYFRIHQGTSALRTSSIQARNAEFKEYVNACEEGVALVAHQILHSHPSVCSFLHPSPISIYTRYNSNVCKITRCMPIRMNLPYGRSSLNNFAATQTTFFPNHGLCLSFTDNTHTILPVAISLLGGRARPLYTANERGKLPVDPPESSGFSWDIDNPELQTHFKGFPLLHVTDAIILQPFPIQYREQTQNMEHLSYIKDDTFAVPRMYAKTWFLTPQLEPGMVLPSPLFGVWNHENRITKYWHGKLRYTTPEATVKEVRRLGCTVKWHRPPTVAFGLVDLRKDVTLVLPSTTVKIPPHPERLVDNNMSCSLCYECIRPVKTGSILCSFHSERLATLVASGPFTTAWLNATILQQDIEFRLPANVAIANVVKDFLRTVRSTQGHQIWVADFEGCVLTTSAITPVHTEVGIVNAASPVIKRYEGYFNYPNYGTADAIAREIQRKKAVVFRSGTFNFNLVRGYFQDLFVNGQPRGLSTDQHRRSLLDLGFQEDKAIMVHWSGGRVDSSGLGRILRNQSGVVTPIQNTNIRCKVIDLRQLWMNCTSYTGGQSLSVVYDTMFPGQTTMYGLQASWHTALWDASATQRLLVKLVEGLKHIQV